MKNYRESRSTSEAQPTDAGPTSLRRILLVEDNPGDVRLLREMFNEQGPPDVKLTDVACMREAERHLRKHPVDVVLLDLGLPDADGLGAIRHARVVAPRIPLVVLTGLDDESLAAQALREGVQDYLIKGQVDVRGLLRALRYAIERKSVEEALFVEKERAEVTLRCIGDAVACTDLLGNVTFLNVVAESMTGWSWREAASRNVAVVVRILEGSSRQTIPNPMAMRAGQDRTLHLPSNCILVRRDGFEIPIEASVAPLRDRQGWAAGAVLVFRDVRAARTMAQQVIHSSQHDFLTGLPNRVRLSDRVNYAIALASRHAKKVAVLFLDLDGFKHINDSLGHPTGDKLLQSVANRLADCLRASDAVSRQGGDEFIVLLSEMEQSEDAAIAARRILEAVAKVHSIAQHDLRVTASIGVSVYPDDGQDAETLIKNADTAMYAAKEGGRQIYRFFEPTMNVRAVERQVIEEGLRRAAERQEFTLQYQPKISLRTGRLTGAEALIRWTHPVRGAVPPAEFIPVAEDCGLILPMGAWVLREACTQARAWADAGLPLASMAVNISSMEWRDEKFLSRVVSILEETGLDPCALELELTESVLMKHAESTVSTLETLRAIGVQVAVDDFGMGYSSLSYLSRFSIDALKIDKSFISGITNEGQDATIVSAVIGMARSLKLRVVAEGVETAEQLKFLQDQQCDEAQGYYFSQPVAPGLFAKLLEARGQKAPHSGDESSVDTMESGVHRKAGSATPTASRLPQIARGNRS
jgi:diguanylate cyclase (GGDEF)-like protein/PAS domain S-box-containing protein